MSAGSSANGSALFAVPVRSSLDVFGVRIAVRTSAAAIGFARTAVSELVIAASELSTNILKYGVSGMISGRLVESPELGPGLELVADDVGPPFHDFATALRDLHDDRGPLDVDARRTRLGLGSGLGAVVRFTHRVEHEARDVGKSIRATRYVRSPR